MKTFRIAFALLGTLLMTCAGVSAQTSAPKVPLATSASDLSKLNIEKIIQQLQTTKIQPATTSEDTSFLQVVAQFLQLTPSQVTELEQLLQTRQAKLVPLFQSVQTLTQQLSALLSSGATPAQIGVVVIQIHALQQQIAQAQQAFLTQFTAILTAEQLQRLQAVQIAAQLQPIVPAFQPIFLF